MDYSILEENSIKQLAELGLTEDYSRLMRSFEVKEDLRDVFARSFSDLDTAVAFEQAILGFNDRHLPKFVIEFRDGNKPGTNEYFAFLLGCLASVRAAERNELEEIAK